MAVIKRSEKWMSFIWTFLWFVIMGIVCAYNTYLMFNHHALILKTLPIAVISGGYFIFLIKPLIKKAKNLKNDENVEEPPEETPHERNFLSVYKRICAQRITAVLLFALAVEIPMVIMSYDIYSNFQFEYHTFKRN